MHCGLISVFFMYVQCMFPNCRECVHGAQNALFTASQCCLCVCACHQCALYIFINTLPSYFLTSLCTYQTSHTLWSSSERLWKINTRSLKFVGEHFQFLCSICLEFAACQSAQSSRSNSAQTFPVSEDLPRNLVGLCFCVWELYMCVGLSVLCVKGVHRCIEFMLYKKICAI